MWQRASIGSGGGTINPTIITNQVLSANQTKNQTIDTSKKYLSVTCSRVADSTKRMSVWYVNNGTLTQLQSNGGQNTLNGDTLSAKNTSNNYYLEWTLIQLD